MAKLSQATVKQKLDEWGLLTAEISKAETARTKAIDPIIARHNEELAPVLKRHDTKIEKLQSAKDSLSGEILGWLDAHGKPLRLEGETAIAEYSTGTKLGDRVIDVKKFLDVAKSKGEAMYDCIQILVQKAEKLIGKKELEQISDRPEKDTKSVTLKLK